METCLLPSHLSHNVGPKRLVVFENCAAVQKKNVSNQRSLKIAVSLAYISCDDRKAQFTARYAIALKESATTIDPAKATADRKTFPTKPLTTRLI